MEERYKSTKNRISYPKIKALAVLLAIATIAGIILSIRFFFFSDKQIFSQVTYPGSKTGTFTYESQKATKDLLDGFYKNLKPKTTVFEYYQIAGKTGTPPASISEYVFLDDQLELLGFYVEQNDKAKYSELNEWIKTAFKSSNGLFVKRLVSADLQIPAGDQEIRIAEQIHYCRILIEGYDRFGQAGDLNMVKTLSTQIYPFCKEKSMLPPEMTIALPQETSIPDFSATPIPKPSILPTIDPAQITYLGVVDLSDIDLYALKLLSSVDEGWNAVYTNCLDVVQKAAIEDPVPFYQAGFDPVKNGYVPYLTQNAEFVFEYQIKIILHLAEVSQMRELTFSYLRQQLFSTRTFFESYQIPTLTPTTENESNIGYALMARIARIREDKDLYDLCVDRIKWTTATNVDSQIYGLPFRTKTDGTILAYANDAIAAIKAFY